MDPDTLSQAAGQITLEALRGLLNVQTNLRDQAERRAQAAQQVLVSLCQVVAPELIEEHLQHGQEVESLPAVLLAGPLLVRANQLVSRAARTDRPPVDMALINQLRAQIETLKAENNQQAEQAQKLSAEVVHLQAENEALRQSIERAGSAVKSVSAPATSEPEWMELWRASRTFERDSQVIQLLGQTGLSRRPQIEARLGELFGVKEDSNSQRAAIKRLTQEWRLLQIERPWAARGSGSGGAHPDLILLSERGRQAYSCLTGSEAVQSEYERLESAHVSPEHTLLNLDAAQILEAEGYTLLADAPVIQLPEGKFIPDLVAKKGEELLFVEVERDTAKDAQGRRGKWLNFHAASGGRLFVVCENLESMREIRKELLDTLGPQRAEFWLTNLAQLRKGERASDGSIWLDQRRAIGPWARPEPE